MPPEGRKIRVSTRAEITRVYEIDVDILLADPYFEAVNLESEEALGDHFEDWLDDEPENWTAPWARELHGLGDGERTVYEVELHPETPAGPCPDPTEHRGEVENSFTSDVYRASCSCGWSDGTAYTSSRFAVEALARHREEAAAALSPGDQDA